jgi:glycosyltransferase involved in cell wall biosynthesis
MATPVVVTRHAGNTEAVADGHSGLVVAERDVEGLAAALQVFLEDPEAVQRFGTAGRALVASRFDLREQARGLERIYDRARSLTA